MPDKPDWMNEEEDRAEQTANTGKTTNDNAPKMVKVTREPTRKQKAFYIQNTYAEAFEDLVHAQKRLKGKKAPQLAEEALDLLFEKYEIDTSKL